MVLCILENCIFIKRSQLKCVAPLGTKTALNKHGYPIVLHALGASFRVVPLNVSGCGVRGLAADAAGDALPFPLGSQFVWRARQQAARLTARHALTVCRAEVTAGFRFHMAVVHFHVHDLHELYLGC